MHGGFPRAGAKGAAGLSPQARRPDLPSGTRSGSAEHLPTQPSHSSQHPVVHLQHLSKIQPSISFARLLIHSHHLSQPPPSHPPYGCSPVEPPTTRDRTSFRVVQLPHFQGNRCSYARGQDPAEMPAFSKQHARAFELFARSLRSTVFAATGRSVRHRTVSECGNGPPPPHHHSQSASQHSTFKPSRRLHLPLSTQPTSPPQRKTAAACTPATHAAQRRCRTAAAYLPPAPQPATTARPSQHLLTTATAAAPLVSFFGARFRPQPRSFTYLRPQPRSTLPSKPAGAPTGSLRRRASMTGSLSRRVRARPTRWGGSGGGGGLPLSLCRFFHASWCSNRHPLRWWWWWHTGKIENPKLHITLMTEESETPYNS